MKIFGSWSQSFDPTRRTILQGAVAAAMIVPFASLMKVKSMPALPPVAEAIEAELSTASHLAWASSLRVGDVIRIQYSDLNVEVTNGMFVVTSVDHSGGADTIPVTHVKTEKVVCDPQVQAAHHVHIEAGSGGGSRLIERLKATCGITGRPLDGLYRANLSQTAEVRDERSPFALEGPRLIGLRREFCDFSVEVPPKST